ncbi:phage tail protein [Chitinophaga japonensis]|uniref:Phage tail-like protein n=1 Tax=Chitinophaga japonensis TaxID=104662 RepID=A0A562STF7_CHIJA|nr:phage tail protein [Chitinophaga japonensis]TWI84531.1 phage tail-like protein [Chitinophaga japonensis]
MSSYYPPVGFRFSVVVSGISGTNEGSFQEVSGLSVKISPMEIKEGGENRFTRRLPVPPKYENLVLKRGMLFGSSLIRWVKTTLTEFTFTPKNVTVNLLDGDGSILAAWSFTNAYPVALKVSDFKAQDSAIVVETLELAYDFFQQTK